MITITYTLAMAIAKDKADRRMREAGRTKWNEEDYNAMVEEFNKRWTVEDALASQR